MGKEAPTPRDREMDKRFSENPVIQKDNFYQSFKEYLELLPPGRPERLALADLRQSYAVSAELVAANAESKKSQGTKKKSDRLKRAYVNSQYATVGRWFGTDKTSRERYSQVVSFFEDHVVFGLIDAETAIIKTQDPDIDKDELKIGVLTGIVSQLKDIELGFAEKVDRLQSKYGEIAQVD